MKKQQAFSKTIQVFKLVSTEGNKIYITEPQ